MSPYPINLRLEGRPVLVVGGGAVALRKVGRLLEAGARVRLVAPEVHPELLALEGSKSAGALEITRRAFKSQDPAGALLAFACTGDDETNRKITKTARAAGALAQSATSPGDCDFTLPSRIERGEFLLTISTGGASPALSKHLRGRLEEVFPPAFGRYIELLGRIRERQLARGLASNENARRFGQLVESDLEAAVLSEKWDEADRILKETLGEDFSLDALGWEK